MKRSKQVARIGLLLLIFAFGCRLFTPDAPLAAPSPSPDTQAAQQSPTPPADTGWQTLHPGMEQRVIRLFADDQTQREQITILRIDPAQYEFRVAYRPGEPQILADWQAATGAQLVVNGGFFTEAYLATGLTIVDGVPTGASYGDFAGMFAVTETGPEVRWLGERPYNPNEYLPFALQSFPMLVKPGGVPGYTTEDGDRARRTVVGQDDNGRILFLIAPWGSFTLYGLSQWLVASDLGLQTALNLDGGTSSGLLLAEPALHIPAFVPLPTVITATPKS